MGKKSGTLELADALGHVHADKRVEILRRVGEAGSISQAAREAGVSYKAAWQALDTLSNLAGAALVQRAVGGAGGGGARLTDAGRQLLQAAGALAQARDRALSRLAGDAGVPAGLAALALRTSMRNQLPCTVRALRPGGGAVRVLLDLPGGDVLAARITRESAQLLALRPGVAVLALCKATAVAVTAGAPVAEGANGLHGTVERGVRAKAGGEVVLVLAGGSRLVGFAPAGCVLRRGEGAIASVQESAVVVAVSG
ncbi:MAG: TOBE domain-containing protein [Pseudomonadota bacterium]